LRRRARDAESFPLAELAAASEGFSGAELEEAINSALYDAFDQKEDLSPEHILTSVRASVPLSRTMPERLAELRAWANGRARLATNC